MLYHGGEQREGVVMASKKNKDLKKKLLRKQLEKQSKKQKKAERKAAKKQAKAVHKAAKKLAKSLSCANGGKDAKAKKSSGAASAAKSKKTAKQGQGTKAGKAMVASNGLSLKLDLGTCPCCSKRCPLAKPKCGKGRAVARKKRERLMGNAVA